MKQKRDRYEMHKYWGKKPSSDLSILIEKYSNVGDTVLDPFSGYGVFCCEAYLLNRNIVSNDLNPIANFINKQLLNKDIDLNKIKYQWQQIKTEFEAFIKKWYNWNLNGENVILISILRDKTNKPLRAKYKIPGIYKANEIELNSLDVKNYMEFEDNFKIEDWYPEQKLIVNSRISAKNNMTICDLFTKRTLACHAKLLSLINKYSSGAERDLFKVAFTANLANCSKLVPPIKSRGKMSQGAWMTGFYVGETYIENNVLSYFENRLNKVIKGKSDFLNQIDQNEIDLFRTFTYNNTVKILQEDAKNLSIESCSVDYIFTDPPYGDAVPYFEQSIIWNSWLKLEPDYENEIVISDSKLRDKTSINYDKDIDLAFKEIYRVLKPKKYFTLTYHSLSGIEWKAITNACIKNGFELFDFQWLVQKSFTPRQINRQKSIKGDVLITLIKSKVNLKYKEFSDIETYDFFDSTIKACLINQALDTNEIFLKIMQIVFDERIIINNVNLLKILTDNFFIADDKKWRINA